MAGLPTLGLPHGALKKRTSHVLMKRTCRVSTTVFCNEWVKLRVERLLGRVNGSCKRETRKKKAKIKTRALQKSNLKAPHLAQLPRACYTPGASPAKRCAAQFNSRPRSPRKCVNLTSVLKVCIMCHEQPGGYPAFTGRRLV